MKKTIWAFALLHSLNVLTLPSTLKPQKLILHFDVNKTLIADDFSVGKTVEDVILYSLADHYKDRWEPAIATPITYSDYIDTYILPGNKSDKTLKQARNKKKLEFIHYLKDQNHPYYPEALSDSQRMKEKLTQSKSIVFNSFFELLKYLHEHEYNFTIILRTFGFDIPRVTQDIEQTLTKKFFTAHAYFKNGKLYTECYDHPLEHSNDMYSFFCNSGHLTVQDDYTQWNSNNEHQNHGKKFLLKMDDHCIISLFFDDNIITESNSEFNIVSPIDATTGQSLQVHPLILRNIIPVNTVQAILDDEYFIKKVINALEHQYDSIKTAN